MPIDLPIADLSADVVLFRGMAAGVGVRPGPPGVGGGFIGVSAMIYRFGTASLARLTGAVIGGLFVPPIAGFSLGRKGRD